jgi:hypothetical protein
MSIGAPAQRQEALDWFLDHRSPGYSICAGAIHLHDPSGKGSVGSDGKVSRIVAALRTIRPACVGRTELSQKQKGQIVAQRMTTGAGHIG